MLKFPVPSDDSVEKRRDLSPKEIVEELDRYIVGQADAKAAVSMSGR